MTYSFPCQDLSLAGKQKGMRKGSGTRSGLLWEVERILDECSGILPDVLLMENVPLVIGKKNIEDFQLWRDKLEQLGYSNYVQILNSKDYGIPQNRERCFMVSLLGDWNYCFPKKKPLQIRLKDVLEQKVDKKYFISQKKLDALQRQAQKDHKPTLLNPETDTHVRTITAQYYKTGLWEQYINNQENTDRIMVAGTLNPQKKIQQHERVIDPKGISPTIIATEHKQPTKILIPENSKTGYAVATAGDGVYINRPHQKRGVVQKGMYPTLTTASDNIGVVIGDENDE
jgi:DNA (cytosine-5)-methyltransferase 1